MDIKVLDAEYYFISPIWITDWDLFEQNLLPPMWRNNEKNRSYSIKPLLSCFLGKAESEEFPINPGVFLCGDLQQSGDKSLSRLNNAEISYVNRKGNPYEGITDYYSLDSKIDLVIASNKRCALLLIHLSSKTKSLSEAVKTVYTLHKTDHQQTPFLCVDRVRMDITLKDLVLSTLPKGGFSLENESRFITASYIRVDASSKEFPIDDVNSALIRLSLSKDMNYRISKQELGNVLPVFDNVLVGSSREGFSTIVLSKDPEHEIDFIKDFSDTFEKSYLSIYLAVALAERVYLSVLRNIDEVAVSTKEQDCFREARLVLSIAPSQYEHLNKLMSHILYDRSLEDKYSIIHESIVSRREQIEFQRLQIEKEQYNLAMEKKESEERRNQTISYLLGFIGVGQVIFAILDLCGASRILGSTIAGGLTIRILAIVLSLAFLVAIFYYIIYSVRSKKK